MRRIEGEEFASSFPDTVEKDNANMARLPKVRNCIYAFAIITVSLFATLNAALGPGTLSVMEVFHKICPPGGEGIIIFPEPIKIGLHNFSELLPEEIQVLQMALQRVAHQTNIDLSLLDQKDKRPYRTAIRLILIPELQSDLSDEQFKIIMGSAAEFASVFDRPATKFLEETKTKINQIYASNSTFFTSGAISDQGAGGLFIVLRMPFGNVGYEGGITAILFSSIGYNKNHQIIAGSIFEKIQDRNNYMLASPTILDHQVLRHLYKIKTPRRAECSEFEQP